MTLTPSQRDQGGNEAMQLMQEASEGTVTGQSPVTMAACDVREDVEHLDTDGPLTRELVDAAKRFDGLVNGLGVSPEISLARRLISSALSAVRDIAESYDACS